MASETAATEQSFLDRLISSRNRNLSLLLPIMLGLTNHTVVSATTTTTNNNGNPLQDSAEADQEPPAEGGYSPWPRDGVVLINPQTQGIVVIEGSPAGLDSLMGDLLSKEGLPPASKASIEALPSVGIKEGEEDGECVVCLEEWEAGGLTKEMPCKHRFHGDCIEKWLGIHGTCPVCRYRMPVGDDDRIKKSGEGREGRREIWVSFSFGGERRSGESASSESTDSTPTPSRTDPSMEN